MPVYLTTADIEAKLEDLKTGEFPDNFELERDSPRDFYGMFPEQLCEHGIRRGLCYPCTPLLTRNSIRAEDLRQIEQEYLEGGTNEH